QLGRNPRSAATLSLPYLDVGVLGVDPHLRTATADGATDARFRLAAVDLQFLKVAGDVSTVRAPVHPESGIRRQHQFHVAFAVVDRNVSQWDLVRVHLNIAVGIL